MKTLPIVYVSRNSESDIMVREYMRRNAEKFNKIIFVTPPEQKQQTIELLSEKESEKILEKMKQLNKDFFRI